MSLPSPSALVSWADLEAAIVSAVKLALPATTVIWEDQGANRPALPYLSLRVSDEECLSELPEQIPATNPTGAVGTVGPPIVVGTELLLQRRVPSEFQLRVQAFSAAVVGVSSARALLATMHNGLDLTSCRDVLTAVGLAIVERGVVQNLSGLIETKFEGRAALDIRMRYTDGVDETATHISTAEITPTLNGVVGTKFTVP
jgi:hypothetical protein